MWLYFFFFFFSQFLSFFFNSNSLLVNIYFMAKIQYIAQYDVILDYFFK